MKNKTNADIYFTESAKYYFIFKIFYNETYFFDIFDIDHVIGASILCTGVPCRLEIVFQVKTRVVHILKIPSHPLLGK